MRSQRGANNSTICLPMPSLQACNDGIGKHIVELLAPRWLRIGGYWHPRGGILNDVFRQYGKVPAGTWIPDQGSLNTEVVDRNVRLF